MSEPHSKSLDASAVLALGNPGGNIRARAHTHTRARAHTHTHDPIKLHFCPSKCHFLSFLFDFLLFLP